MDSLEFNFDHVYDPSTITRQHILSVITEYDIYRYYIGKDLEIGKLIQSPFRKDTNPSFNIFYASNGNLLFKDFGSDCGDCIKFVEKLFNCDRLTALKRIARDFNLSSLLLSDDNYRAVQEAKSKIVTERKKKILTIVPQAYTPQDIKFWNKYGIGIDILHEYNVLSARAVYMDGERIKSYKKDSPVYAYRFTNGNEISYKIYSPYAEGRYKWLFNGTAEDIEGYDQLPHLGDILILTKSLKDAMVYHVLGYAAISLQGEGNKFDYDLYQKLSKRFETIIVNYDNDEPGIKYSNKVCSQYDLPYFFIEGEKDISDFVKVYGLEAASQFVNEKIEGIRDRSS